MTRRARVRGSPCIVVKRPWGSQRDTMKYSLKKIIQLKKHCFIFSLKTKQQIIGIIAMKRFDVLYNYMLAKFYLKLKGIYKNYGKPNIFSLNYELFALAIFLAACACTVCSGASV